MSDFQLRVDRELGRDRGKNCRVWLDREHENRSAASMLIDEYPSEAWLLGSQLVWAGVESRLDCRTPQELRYLASESGTP